MGIYLGKEVKQGPKFSGFIGETEKKISWDLRLNTAKMARAFLYFLNTVSKNSVKII